MHLQVWYGYPAGRHNHLPVLRDFREGAVRDGKHGCAAVLDPVPLPLPHCSDLARWRDRTV